MLHSHRLLLQDKRIFSLFRHCDHALYIAYSHRNRALLGSNSPPTAPPGTERSALGEMTVRVKLHIFQKWILSCFYMSGQYTPALNLLNLRFHQFFYQNALESKEATLSLCDTSGNLKYLGRTMVEPLGILSRRTHCLELASGSNQRLRLH